ncbi:MAG TPA: hypothetical protein VGA06_00300 [Candidatus Paceibacterota bacterium]|jgi:hypothetical protein
MDQATKIVIGLVIALVLFGTGRFIYQNIIVPWPYRDELNACLKDARALDSKTLSEAAENSCFQTYPHFL